MVFSRLLRRINPLRRGECRQYCRPMFDPLDHLTGIEKKEMLAAVAGDCDPWRIMAVKKGDCGSRERPVLVPSAFGSRLVGCQCPGHEFQIKWLMLHQGEPKRCGCGYFIELCPSCPF